MCPPIRPAGSELACMQALECAHCHALSLSIFSYQGRGHYSLLLFVVIIRCQLQCRNQLSVACNGVLLSGPHATRLTATEPADEPWSASAPCCCHDPPITHRHGHTHAMPIHSGMALLQAQRQAAAGCAPHHQDAGLPARVLPGIAGAAKW